MSQLYGEMVIGDFDRMQIYVQCIGCRSSILLSKNWGSGKYVGRCRPCQIEYRAYNQIEITVNDYSGSGIGFGQ